MKKLTEADQAAIRDACQKAMDLDKQVAVCARRYAISEDAVRRILSPPAPMPVSPAAVKASPSKPTINPEFEKAFDPPPPTKKKPGRPKSSTLGTEPPKVGRKPRKPAGQLSNLQAAISGLTHAFEDVDRYLPLSGGERAVMNGYFARLQCFESGVAFAEGNCGKEVPDGTHQG